MKSLRNQLKCAELSIIQLSITKMNIIIIIIESQLRERDLKIEELNQTIHQISQNKLNPTVQYIQYI